MSIVPWKLDIQRRKLIYVHETHIAIYFQSRFHPRNKDTQATVLICLLIIQNKILPISNKNFVVSCLKELKGISMQSQKLPIAKQNGIEFCDNGLPSLFHFYCRIPRHMLNLFLGIQFIIQSTKVEGVQ